MVAIVLAASMLIHLWWVAAPAPVAPLPKDAPTGGAGTPSDMLAQSLGHPLLPAALESGPAATAPRPMALDARLRGVSTGLKVPVAIIDHAGAARVVSEGDALGAARIERILPDRVLLEHAGRLETLSLRHEAAASAGGGPPSADAGAEAAGERDAEMDQWMNNLSEADPETAAWLRERMRELYDQPAND
jgi:hypothetical protein